MEYLILAAVAIYFFHDILLDALKVLFNIVDRIQSHAARRRSKTYLDERGYKRFSDSDKPVHRWVAELKLGRKLRPGEVVHHKNRKKTDNNPDNLHVFPNQAAHDRAHKIDAMRHGKRASYQGFDKDA